MKITELYNDVISENLEYEYNEPYPFPVSGISKGTSSAIHIVSFFPTFS